MKIAVVGTGYVGLVTGTCFADSGNEVTCVDIDKRKIDALNRGEIPIYEPGLAELVEHNVQAQRLRFTTDLAAAVKPADIVYLAVGTPQGDDGAANLSALWSVVENIAPHLRSDAIVVTKSTVPVGTCARIAGMLREFTGRDCDVASNPEFLKEGAAIEDFMKPDRVVVGVRRPEVADCLHQLYEPFLRTEKPFLAMSPESAEMTKYVANAMLSTKISFINEMANLCERMGGDINDVRRGIGHDSRIGFAFLFPGVGYGGSCFPKDVRALQAMALEHGVEPTILRAVDAVNERQKSVLAEKIREHFQGRLAGKTLAVWGLAFKPRTDDIREAPALVLIDWLLQQGATVRVHDPEALKNVAAQYGDKLIYCEMRMDALEGADALCIMTEWKDYHSPDFAEMYQLLKSPVIFDGRNLYEPDRMRRRGYKYYSIGRPAV
ncbi:MAG: UDP-glucose 6-dehydrogenase [Planctomycetota bacterium]|nr:MAG: UDP-glucose 6-dehydrogenase [Planctomycetota bacterium]